MSALHVLKVSSEELIYHYRWHERMQRASSRPAPDMFLIWTGRQTGRPVDRLLLMVRARSHIYIAKNTKADAAEQANANLNKNYMESWISGCKYETNKIHLWPLCWTEPGSESNSAVFRQRCGHSQQTALTVKLQVCKISKTPKNEKFAHFHPVKPKIEKKKKIVISDNLWQLSTHNFELFCHKQNTTCHIFTLHGWQHTPTPPLSVLCLWGG